MLLRNIIVFILLVLTANGVWAAPKKDNISRIAEDTSGFSDSIDISDMKPGKYNYYLEAKDKANNITLSGPENIINDPESDIPRVTIINPIPFMSVQGNLNIVGLAFDDDGVEQVEFVIYRGTDGKGEEVFKAKASGTDYFSYFLDTSDSEMWKDGDYTIVAWAVDKNGLSGISGEYPNGMKIPVKAQKTHKVFWRLDRKKPETIVTSHEVGAFVSGNIKMRGTVSDGNGIKSLAFSTDGGIKYELAKVSADKKSSSYSWEININTKTLEDGPAVIWFKATDRNGSIGTAAHLLFSNNNGPDVKIVYPEANATVNGIFYIAGYAKHPVGLKKVTWKAGISSGEFELLPGNHWWSAEVDIRNQKLSGIDVEIRAEDVSGNVTISRQKYKVYKNKDLPVVILDEPVITIPSAGVLKDTKPPQVSLIMPISEAKVNGTIKMAFSIEELGAMQSISYKRNAAAPAREIFNASDWEKDYDLKFIEVLMDSIQMPLDNNMRFIFTDKAGNSSEFNTWPFVIDQEMDIPVVQIILPQDNEVITTDFIISGVMFDDDGIKNIQYRIDNTPWQTLEAKNGFSVPININSLTDNEHLITVIAEDIYGVRSAPVTRNFRVSLTEPTGTISYPLNDTVLKDLVEVKGTAFDRNGIQRVAISIDNGNTFNTVRGTFGTPAETVQWNYQFNTKILKDGAHVIFIRVWDRCGIPATYASMINIDNTLPEIVLDSPGDGSITSNSISIMGRVLDPNLQEISIQMRSLDGAAVRENLRSRKLSPNMVVKELFDLTGQADGHYNLAITATDKAGNVSRLSRNFEIARQTYKNYVEILYPLVNEEMSGDFILYGFSGGSDTAKIASIRVNGKDLDETEVDDNGFFRFLLTGENLNEGENQIIVHSNFGSSTLVQSRPYNINYRKGGPWVTIESFNFGDFAYDRPYLTGRAGYQLSDEDKKILADKSADKEAKAKVQAKVLDFTEISFDNGRTFVKTSKAAQKGLNYQYRIETYDMTEGSHYIVVRSTMKNGEIAVTRMLVQVDKTPPVIRLISPEAGSRYNNEIAYSASAADDVELVSLTYHLRMGDKSMYEVPGFLQGLYLEAVIPPFIRQLAPDVVPEFFAGGATYTDFGLGLSFFNDNVKIQGQYGFMFQKQYDALSGNGENSTKPVRYGGHVLGIKLLANVFTLPFITILGPDFEWLYASFALGANFSYFDAFNTENEKFPGSTYTQSGASTWMSALLLQIEFPKVSIPKRSNFKTFSLFTEGQLWFVPTDVDAHMNEIPVVVPHIIVGLRMYIF